MNFASSSSDALASTHRCSRLLIPVLLALGMMVLSSCASKEDKDDKPPKRKEPNYRDAVEQRVFYDGWFQR
ncbi:MAG: hypothetical protein JWO94_3126 [Verrucomicrobiaceae bacterium]|nr:hypothetical protein [Verrucomicrobiaceae bacterium]